jgi:hypothetical protein
MVCMGKGFWLCRNLQEAGHNDHKVVHLPAGRQAQGTRGKTAPSAILKLLHIVVFVCLSFVHFVTGILFQHLDL